MCPLNQLCTPRHDGREGKKRGLGDNPHHRKLMEFTFAIQQVICSWWSFDPDPTRSLALPAKKNYPKRHYIGVATDCKCFPACNSRIFFFCPWHFSWVCLIFCTLQPPLSCHCFEQFALGCACLWKPLSSTWGAASASSTQPNSKWNCFWYHKSWTIWKWKILSFVLMTGSRIKGQQVTNGKTKSITSPYILDGSVESVESRHNLTGSSA